MSNTQNTKPVGRPKGTGSTLVKLQDLVDKFGANTEVPVRWKWLQTETAKLTKSEASSEEVEDNAPSNGSVNRQVPQATLTP